MNNSMFNEMLARLQAMGLQRGAEHLPERETTRSRTIDQVVDGQYAENEFGRVFVVEKNYALPYRHGQMLLDITHNSACQAISQVTSIPHAFRWDQKTLYFDTETSGLSTGAGTFAFLYGFAYFDGAQLILKQFFMPDPVDEGALVLELDKFLGQFELLVSFNGKSFDAPILKTRFALNGYRSPLTAMEHLDLLHYARRIWKLRLPSRALKDLERDIFSFQRAEEEVPGWMVPQLYTDYLFTQDASPLGGVLYHNEVDVLSLAVLHHYLAVTFEDDEMLAELPFEDRYSIAALFRNAGLFERASLLFRTCREQQDNGLYLRAMLEHAAMHKRNQDWDAAITIWQDICLNFENAEALIELAKVAEHRTRDLQLALSFATRAQQATRDDLIANETQARIKRLEFKLKRLSGE